MTTYFGKSCSFGLLCASFAGVCQIVCVCVFFFPFSIEDRMWDVTVLIPDHYTPANCVWGGIYCFDAVLPSVRPSVLPSATYQIFK